MKGRILGYNGSDFRGLISGHDGQRYDFVRIDWHGAGEPGTGLEVDFQIDGTKATDIFPLTVEPPAQPYQPTFGQARPPFGQASQPQQPYGQPNQAYQPYGQAGQTYPPYGQAYAQSTHEQPMGFGEAIGICFKKYATFSGRARRSEYWYFVLFNLLAQIVASFLDAAVTRGAASSGPFSGLLTLGLFLPSLAVLTRRLHDTDRSGFWVLGFYGAAAVSILAVVFAIVSQHDAPEPTHGAALTIGSFGLVLIAVAIWMLVMVCTKGTHGANRYGPDPLSSPADAF